VDIGGIYADLVADPARMIAGIAAAKKAMDDLQAETVRLFEAFKNGKMDSDELAQRCASLGQTLQQLSAMSASAQASLGGMSGSASHASQAASAASSSMRGLSESVRNAGASAGAATSQLDTLSSQVDRSSPLVKFGAEQFDAYGQSVLRAGASSGSFASGSGAVLPYVERLASASAKAKASFDAFSASVSQAGASGNSSAGYFDGLLSRFERTRAAVRPAATEFDAYGQSLLYAGTSAGTCAASGESLFSSVERSAAAAARAKADFASFSASVAQAGASAGSSADYFTTLENRYARTKTANKDASGGFLGLSQAIRQVGYVADDMQYGFQSIVNNISPMTEGFIRGGLAAKRTADEMKALATTIALSATGVQVAAVVANQLYQNWDKIKEAFGHSIVETHTERIERLGKATHKTAEETAELNRQQERQQQIESLRKQPGTEAGEISKVAKFNLTNDDPEAVFRGISTYLHAAERGNKPGKDIEKALNIKHGGEGAEHWQKTFAGIRRAATGEKRSPQAIVKEEMERIGRQTTEEHARDLMLASMKPGAEGAEARGKITEMTKRNPEFFPGGFGYKMEFMSPERMKAREERHEAGKIAVAEAESLHKGEREDADRKDKEDADQKRFAAENDQKNRERMEQARKALPGLDEKTETAALRSKIKGNFESGGSLGIARQISSALQAKGWDVAEAMSAGASAVGSAGERVDEKAAKIETHPKVDMAGMIKENMAWGMTKKAATRTAMKKVAMMGAEGEGQAEAGSILANQRWDQARISRSETFGTSQLTSKVQSAITNGGDDKNMGKNMNKVANVVDEMYKLLAQKNAGNTFTIKVD
jgi:hypothetical protein